MQQLDRRPGSSGTAGRARPPRAIRRYLTAVGLVGLMASGAIACGPSDDGDANREGEASKSSSPKEAAAAQDLCAKLDAAAIEKIAGAIGRKAKVEEYEGKADSETYLPAVDTCDLAYAGAPVPKPTGGGKVIREGGGGDGEIEFRLTIAPMTMKDYRHELRWAKKEADDVRAPVSEVPGLGDAAFYTEIQSNVLVGDRLLQIVDRGSGETKKRFRKIAETVLPVVEELPKPPAEVNRPTCDPLTKAARAAVQREIEVRRDIENGSRTYCGWAAHSRSFQVNVATDDDPKAALKNLREDEQAEEVSVGDEGYYVEEDQQIIFRKGSRHYQASFWSLSTSDSTKRKKIAAVKRFAKQL